MTLDELKKKIVFSRRIEKYEIQIRCRAEIYIGAEIGIHADLRRQPPQIEVERRLTDEILRRLYADRQHEFAELLEQHARMYPLSMEFADSRNKLIGMARYLKPND